MEFGRFLWETFSHTGNIDAYLLYKDAYQFTDKDRDEECQLLAQEV